MLESERALFYRSSVTMFPCIVKKVCLVAGLAGSSQHDL